MLDATGKMLPMQRVTLSSDALVQQVGSETVLLDLASEQYFGLDPVGTRIWALLGEMGEVSAVFERLCDEYDADPACIQIDLLALLGQLSDAGLVKVG